MGGNNCDSTQKRAPAPVAGLEHVSASIRIVA